MKYWIVSDTHFCHDMLVEANLRPPNADELMVKHWNNQVKPEDVVIHLGDTAWPRAYEQDIFNKLPGKKILVMGNHDRKSAQWYMEHGFDFVCNQFMLKYGGFDIVFTHMPWINHPYDVNVHGHYHDNFNREIYNKTPWLYCVSMEVLNYQPLSMHRLIKELQAKHAAYEKKNPGALLDRERMKIDARHISVKFISTDDSSSV